ncbi:YtcA family lipoprotein [Vibrio metschnikovii]|uniref:YtcA family lipoprotein n=1 Tax=Vibrio metschnikovii TaxID=28172 RepID=UPI003557D036
MGWNANTLISSIRGISVSPLLPFYGVYFPSWLICAMIGIISTVLIRIVLIRLGVDEGIPLRTIVYIALASMITLTLAITVFGV